MKKVRTGSKSSQGELSDAGQKSRELTTPPESPSIGPVFVGTTSASSGPANSRSGLGSANPALVAVPRDSSGNHFRLAFSPFTAVIRETITIDIYRCPPEPLSYSLPPPPPHSHTHHGPHFKPCIRLFHPFPFIYIYIERERERGELEKFNTQG